MIENPTQFNSWFNSVVYYNVIQLKLQAKVLGLQSNAVFHLPVLAQMLQRYKGVGLWACWVIYQMGKLALMPYIIFTAYSLMNGMTQHIWSSEGCNQALWDDNTLKDTD